MPEPEQERCTHRFLTQSLNLHLPVPKGGGDEGGGGRVEGQTQLVCQAHSLLPSVGLLQFSKPQLLLFCLCYFLLIAHGTDGTDFFKCAFLR